MIAFRVVVANIIAMFYLVGMKYLNIKEAQAFTGKSPRTIRGRVANLSKEDKKRFIKRGKKNALLINEKWLLDNFKGSQKEQDKKNSIELYERLLVEKEARINDLQRQLEEANNHITQTNQIIRETNYKGLQKLLELEGESIQSADGQTKDNNGNWFSRLMGKKIV
jgi:hypothetical protein